LPPLKEGQHIGLLELGLTKRLLGICAVLLDLLHGA
jgi:hypothetical protein